jgi:hypothetical protein
MSIRESLTLSPIPPGKVAGCKLRPAWSWRTLISVPRAMWPPTTSLSSRASGLVPAPRPRQSRLWGVGLLALAGLGLQTAASIPVDTQPLVPTDTFDAAFLQTAYHNYVYDQTAHPGEEVNSNLVDEAFSVLLAHNPDFAGYVGGEYTTVTVTSTLDQQMRNFYFQADKYDNGRLVTHTAPGSASVPGNYVWSYLWDCTGAPTTPSVPKP